MRRTLFVLSLFGSLALIPAAYAQTAALTRVPASGVNGPASGVTSLTTAPQPLDSTRLATRNLVALGSDKPTITSIAASPSSVFQGTPVTITADVQTAVGGTAPTGTVSFYVCSGTYLGTATLFDTTASITAPTLKIAPGTYLVKAVYSGDSQYASSSSSCVPVTVMNQGNSTSDMAASPSSITPGEIVTLATDVSPNQGGPIPTGVVDFYEVTNGTYYYLGQATLVSGVATLYVPTTGIPAGTYHVVSVYQGSSIYEPSTSETDTILVQ
jgi:hypothetical protein